MGGQGSGNWCHYWRPPRKNTVEECITINLFSLARQGVFRPGRSGTRTWHHPDLGTFSVNHTTHLVPGRGLSLTLSYRLDGQAVRLDVPLVTTPMPSKGRRWWGLCPVVHEGRPCARRVGTLYLPLDDTNFGCRTCHDLSYTSSQSSRQFDSLFRLLARDLDWDTEEVKWALNRVASRQ